VALFSPFFINHASANYLNLQQNLASSVAQDVQATVVKPFNLETWKASWPFLLSFGLLYTQDEVIDRYIRQNYDYEKLVYAFNWDYAGYAAWAAMYVLGREKEKKVAIEMAEAVADTVIIATSMKHGFGRIRPILEQGAYTFRGPNTSSSYNSFPSYHVTWAFSWAQILGREYNQEWPAYLVATYYVLQPYKSHNHWMSDMFFAAGMGIYLGNMVVDRSNGLLEEKAPSSWEIRPLLGVEHTGILISNKF
jgi:hypothetical protein